MIPIDVPPNEDVSLFCHVPCLGRHQYSTSWEHLSFKREREKNTQFEFKWRHQTEWKDVWLMLLLRAVLYLWIKPRIYLGWITPCAWKVTHESRFRQISSVLRGFFHHKPFNPGSNEHESVQEVAVTQAWLISCSYIIPQHYYASYLSQNIFVILVKPIFCSSEAWNIPCNNSWLPTLINSEGFRQ